MRDHPKWLGRGFPGLCSIALIVALAAASLLAFGRDAHAMIMLESRPKVDEMIEGKGVSFALRFDQPVSHRSSRLILVTPQGQRSLGIRIDTEVDTLYAFAGDLADGKYELQWEAHATDGTVISGSIHFSVGKK
ncbi:MAG TPA: copper resistance protein CopC [Stellaceae bacterium]|nr:copper resistance protein CopC [Stellaceae bacterium]